MTKAIMRLKVSITGVCLKITVAFFNLAEDLHDSAKILNSLRHHGIAFKLQFQPCFLDSEASKQSAASFKDSHDFFTMQPQERAIVLKLKEVSLVQYSGLAFNWSSNSSSLNFTMDYSIDGFHWVDYVEDERVKVKMNKKFLIE